MGDLRRDLGLGELCELTTLIDTYGWVVHTVDAAAQRPPMAYTIGCGRFAGGFEVLVAGLPAEPAGLVLNAAATRLAGGWRPPIGEPVSGVLDGRDVRFVPGGLLAVALCPVADAWWAHHGTMFDVVQLLWPDPAGRFPLEAGCDPAAQSWQDLRRF